MRNAGVGVGPTWLAYNSTCLPYSAPICTVDHAAPALLRQQSIAAASAAVGTTCSGPPTASWLLLALLLPLPHGALSLLAAGCIVDAPACLADAQLLALLLCHVGIHLLGGGKGP